MLNSTMLKEFKEFALKGNVVDLAVGVIIGAAFNDIVNSLVKHIFTPLLGLLTGGINFADRTSVVNGVPIKWGEFVQSTINFVLVATVLFFFVKLMNKLNRKEEIKEKKSSAEVKLLREIRDLLAKKKPEKKL
jgi:large conductance mechanosensitive channel